MDSSTSNTAIAPHLETKLVSPPRDRPDHHGVENLITFDGPVVSDVGELPLQIYGSSRCRCRTVGQIAAGLENDLELEGIGQ